MGCRDEAVAAAAITSTPAARDGAQLKKKRMSLNQGGVFHIILDRLI